MDTEFVIPDTDKFTKTRFQASRVFYCLKDRFDRLKPQAVYAIAQACSNDCFLRRLVN
jgi:hypothetical protein